MSKSDDNNNKVNWSTVVLNDTGKFLEAITTGHKCQTRFRLIPTEHLNKATRAGIIDGNLGRLGQDGYPKGAPIIRFDNPHGGKGVSQSPHINIDPKGFSNANNPHIRVPASLIDCADKVDKILKGVSKWLTIAAVIIDGVRICAAIYEDCTADDNHVLPMRTIRTIAEIAGGWIGGAIGAKCGAVLGAAIGACVGSLFGGVGAVIGAPIGAIIGGLVGGTVGGLLGRYLAGQFIDRQLGSGGDGNTAKFVDMVDVFETGWPLFTIVGLNPLLSVIPFFASTLTSPISPVSILNPIGFGAIGGLID
ncbi:uncharacterized protein LOC128954041 [Oppia nitens]|uniref:uncharacterized protein LOC128954041 n=1 Tax=Oppia nitens TaxID=1686743 RepID=UPI0023DAB26D|nr:uncharacterized protein LOC128954041 [Oppia nitens]